ncbi:helix-turn-helix domain containing protein [Amycolatopsis cynarae]|uniref:Helix-turn-helix domain containing protein n=2 Tax=Amycolatopsis cynarae TaxID=2995223 RepID=A0ABY7AZH4_9PSEU|nr:TetR/AcrR family transcriptional regulator [Amycolatopsis sp. HUAS 11-8]WAL64863.1 helix-turn-helix domain containing protein [Amycolatopsis sp. HUAS 11-8]
MDFMTRDTPRTATTRPLRRDAERNRQRIIAAAREVFRERGFETTLDDVAHHAGLGVGTVYRRFPNKEHLVEAMLAERLDQVAELAGKAKQDADAWTAFQEFLWQAAELLTGDRGLHDVLLSTQFGHDRVAQARDRLIPVIRDLVQRAKETGSLRADFEPEDLPLLFKMIGAVAEYTHAVAPEAWRRYVGLLMDSLRAAPGPPTPLPVPALDIDALQCAMDQPCRTRVP